MNNEVLGLNALSGIGGFRTNCAMLEVGTTRQHVLMPCRALEVFGLRAEFERRGLKWYVLMPCRALEVFGQYLPGH